MPAAPQGNGRPLVGPAMSPKLSKKELADRIQALCVLVLDDNQYMRKMIRNHHALLERYNYINVFK
jgi:hypothetical protein